MLIHPDRPFLDAHERHAERMTGTTPQDGRPERPRPTVSPSRRDQLLAALRRSAAAAPV